MSYPTAALPFSASAQFFGSEVPAIGPYSVQIKEAEYCHDVAVLKTWADDVDSDSYQSGMPVAITFGRPTAKRYFYGYVDHSRRVNNALANVTSLGDRNSTVVTCVGATWPMKTSGNLSWRNQTVPQVIEQIAEIFGLEANVDPHSTVWPTLHMAGMSYWQFGVSLAQRIGYTFYGNGVQLCCKQRNTDPANLTGIALLYDYRNDPSSMPVFSPVLGASNPYGGQLLNRQTAGINPRTLVPFVAVQGGIPSPTVLGGATNQPVFASVDHYVADTQGESQAKISGAGLQNQLYLTAEATAAGSALVTKGSLIAVLNANGSQNGLWFVTGSDHVIDKMKYQMNLRLGRDSLGSASVVNAVPQTNVPMQAALTSNLQWVSA